jgi:putative DNA primase/helicase
MRIPGELEPYIASVWNLMFRPTDVVEMRALRVPHAGTVSGYYDNPHDLARDAERLNGRANVYITINPVIRDLLARSYNHATSYARDTTSDDHIARRRWILVDFDAVRPSNISATDPEHASALERAAACRGWLWSRGIPTCYMDSGNGAHLLVPIDLPNSDDSTDLIRRFLQAVSREFSDDAVKVDRSTFNPSRITKLYYTLSVKGDNLPERPWRQSYWMEGPQVADVASHGAIMAVSSLIATTTAVTGRENSREAIQEVEAMLRRVGLGHSEAQEYNGGLRWVLNACPFNPQHRAPDSAVFLIDGITSFRCLHNSCADRGMAELREMLEPRPVTSTVDFTGVEGLAPPPPEGGEQVPQQAGEPEERITLTDSHNAVELIRLFGDQVRWWLEKEVWLDWDGQRWVERGDLQMLHYANETLRRLTERVGRLPDEQTRVRLLRELRGFWGERSVMAMLRLARQHCVVRSSDLDQDVFLLNLQNGTLDLRTAELRPHDRRDMITKLAPVRWDGLDAWSDAWRRHLEYFLPDGELVGFLQRFLGYCLTGETRERKILIMHGVGSNGKTLILRVMGRLLGDYAMPTSADVLLARKGETVPNDLARLQGARFIYASETDQGRRFAEARIKEWTGKDVVTARFLHKEYFSFVPQGKLVLGTNHRPIIVGTDEAIWDRVPLLPFNVRMPEELKRPHDVVEAEFMAEASGILGWLVRGCIEWQQIGLRPPTQVVQATQLYRRDMDILGQFIEEQCESGPDQFCVATELYAAYLDWCRLNSENAQSQRLFSQNLRERRYESYTLEGSRFWRGITIRQEYRNPRYLFTRENVRHV